MFDISSVGIVRVESLKMRSAHGLGSEGRGVHGYGRIRGRTELHREAGRAAVSGTSRFGTIQIAADARNRSAGHVAARLLAALRQLQHRARTFPLMRASTYGRSQHDGR